MIRLRLALLAVLLVPSAVLPARAQLYRSLYRPPEARYLELRSPHFRVIYEEGLEEEAREAASLLEAALPGVRVLVDQRRPLRMPVVLNRFNDRANGYVTPLPFKQEIEGIAIKGHRISPRFPSWLHAVVPHELVHAVHAESGRGVGVGWALRTVAPDLSRAVNLTVPAGFAEGLAVYHESTLHAGAGRLGFSLFEMAFRAAMSSDDPWSLTQLLEAPAFTRPFDRHYNGGGHLFAHMAEQDRLGFFPRARDFVYRMPYLGFGLPLWYGTGEAPWTLGRRFREAARTAAAAHRAALGPLTASTVVSSARGLVHHRPRWLDDRTLLVHVQGYDVRPGFYRVDAATGLRTPLSYQHVTEDHYFTVDGDTSTVLFSRYVTDRTTPLEAVAEVFALDLATGAVARRTAQGRMLGPAAAPGGGFWALRNDGQFNDWVHVDASGGAAPLTGFDRSFFKEIAPSPDGGAVAVLLNVRGRQGLFRAEVSERGVQLDSWVMFEDATVYDVSWGPEGRYLLLTADPGGVANVFALDVASDRLLRLTNVPFGAMEPALSPDGRTVAYVEYRHERYDLVRIPFEPEAAWEVPSGTGAYGDAVPWRAWLAAGVPDHDGLTSPVPYRALRSVRPRAVYPTLRRAPGATSVDEALAGLGVGLAAEGTDPLERWAFRGEGFVQRGRPWGEVWLSSSASVLRPTVRVYATPSRVSLGPHMLDRAERGAELGLRLPLVLSSNVFRTEASLALHAKYREDRLYDLDGEPAGPFLGHATLQPSAALAYRVQSNVRDIVPNSGLVLQVRGSTDAWAEAGRRGHWVNPRVDLYLPLLRRSNTGIHLFGSVIAQSRGGLLDLSTFVPRGYDVPAMGRGAFARVGAEISRPLWYVDDGFLLVPVYFKALYAFGFGETMGTLRHEGPAVALSSAGAGLGLHFRLLHVLDLHLKAGAAYRFEDGAWRLSPR